MGEKSNSSSQQRRRVTFALVVAFLFTASTSLSNLFSPRRRNTCGSFQQPLQSRTCRVAHLLELQSTRNKESLEGTDGSFSMYDSFRELRRAVLLELRQASDLESAKSMICAMIEYLQDCFVDTNRKVRKDASNATVKIQPMDSLVDHVRLSESIDEALQVFFARAFATPMRGGQQDARRVKLGVELLQLQLASSDVLAKPFSQVPKEVVVQALAAVTTLQERQKPTRKARSENTVLISPDVAFRLLQRLVTGFGIRNHSFTKNNERPSFTLYEVTFNRVLNVYSNLGNMHMAHRVIALQERTPHAPSLSPVTYSILVKGYGKLGDWNNIDMVLQHAANNGILPDTILFNSLIDSYVNCNQLDKAQSIFDAMIGKWNREHKQILPFPAQKCPSPNLRSYNTILKGLAKNGRWEEAKSLATELKGRGWWDHVTTNTLVQAAVEAKDFTAAKDLLDKHTLTEREKANRHYRHPNSDGYTSLIDGYSRNGNMDNALLLLKDMRSRRVEINEFHFSSLIGGLARRKNTGQAKNLLAFVQRSQIPVKKQLPIYRALISGLVHRDMTFHEDYDRRVDDAFGVLRDMIQAKVAPDVHVVAMLLEGCGHCRDPRVVEATALVDQLEKTQVIPPNDAVVGTGLIRVFAACGDFERATKHFRSIRDPDTAAVNAFLDAAVRCGHSSTAMETFDLIFAGEHAGMVPDVISYSIVIGGNLRKETFDGARTARDLYEQMRFQRRIFPDKVLVDIVIRGMVENSRKCGVLPSDARFLASVLRDAEELEWGPGKLQRRKQAVEYAMSKQNANVWDEEANLYGIRDDVDGPSRRDRIFIRHGWNEVDSGFKLWGAGRKKEKPSNTDGFLKSKGWNDMDSGFRII